MPMELGLWRADGDQMTRITPTAVGLEVQLEKYIESDPSLLGESLLIVGRQVPTAFGGFLDLLALDETGSAHVIELKRDKTPREVTAQTLDYASWVATLGRTEIVDIFTSYKPGVPLEEAFADQFGQAPPEDLNTSQVLTIVAGSLDGATERIVRFLNETFGVPINVVLFRHFVDGGSSYLARTWLVDHETPTSSGASSGSQRKSREPWNGNDWYISFGEGGDGRRWEDALRYGFVSAGGDKWYSRTLKNVPVGARVFTCIPGRGYVGVGTVLNQAQRFDEATVIQDGREARLAALPLVGGYLHGGDEDDDVAEWAVAVEWLHAVPRDEAVWRQGMFANQNSATKLRNQFTIDQVVEAFGLAE